MNLSKTIPCYGRHGNSRKTLDENTKYQPWTINIWMKKPNLNDCCTKIELK
jgi:hypothetical protein